MRPLRCVICFIFCIISGCSYALPTFQSGYPDDSPDISELIQQAQEKKLSAHPHWQALLHYRVHSSGIEQHFISEVISPEFFLAEDGANNPAAELVATLRAFFQAPSQNPDQHAQCRFVARFKWLQKSLDWAGHTPPVVSCEQFTAWSMEGRIQSLSLIFATGYFSNPASYYGHLLLRFNTPDPMNIGQLLDTSINYGAIVAQHESALTYIFKGIFGGYEAGFSHDKFYRHNHNYAESELRDLWEYELALSQDEIDEIVAHSWELLRMKFVYYFFKENCAYRLAELLELVVDQPLAPNTPWSIPHSVFDQLAKVERNGAPLLKKVTRIPSRQNRFYAKYSALSNEQQHFIKQLITNSAPFQSISYQQLLDSEKIRTLETLFDYYEFRIAQDDDTADLKRMKKNVLIERLKLPSQNSSWPELTQSPPHLGHPPSMAQISPLKNNQLGYGLELRLRPAYYDFMALDAGRVPYSNLSMFDLKLAYIDSAVRFRSLDLINIETLNLSRTNLPGDGGYAWKIKSGWEQQNLSCASCTVFSLDGGLGKAFPVYEDIVVYGMLEGRTQTPANGSGTLAVATKISLLFSPTASQRTQITLGQRTYLNGMQQKEPIIHFESSWHSSHTWDWRLLYEKHVAHEIKISLSSYF